MFRSWWKYPILFYPNFPLFLGRYLTARIQPTQFPGVAVVVAALALLLAFDSRLSCLLTLLQHHWASCLRDQPWPSNLVNFNTLIPWLSRASCKSWHNYSLCHNIAAGRTYTLVCSNHPPCLATRNKTKDFALVKMNCDVELWGNLSLWNTYTTSFSEVTLWHGSPSWSLSHQATAVPTQVSCCLSASMIAACYSASFFLLHCALKKYRGQGDL